ncbi:sulfotransferase, partial [Akkermansiaceae bacterium]|nr:sulfotransferase [Akkermansiaceae bacterium]
MNDQPKPEFIIIGAMKCGTSSLHRALEQHPRVFIPEGEMKYYSMDDLEQNTVFFRHQENQWIAQNFAENHAASLTLYQQRYLNCPRDSIAGEDASSYLAITEVAKRLHENLPEVKLIVILRDPVARTYSHYWHNVASFRAHYDFEDSLRFAQENLLRR